MPAGRNRSAALNFIAMKRRSFLYATGLAGLGIPLGSMKSCSGQQRGNVLRGSFSQNGHRVSIFTKAELRPTRIFHITDTHLSLDDERGIPYGQFSKRMAGAYLSNSHFQTGEFVSAEESFEQTLQLAREEDVDFLALSGDIFSFPSQAAVEWAYQKLKDCGIPFAYVAGNHDWHYEGMQGSANRLRETWTQKHLYPMYQGKNPLYASYEINGIRLVCIDNSTYEILPEQLTFFNEQVAKEIPLVLVMHIPLYMPGRALGYGCAHPEWGEASDRGYEIEAREKWRRGGHTEVTFAFRERVLNAPNLLVILAGHTHRPAIDLKNGIPQLVSGHNAAAYYTDITISSLKNQS